VCLLGRIYRANSIKSLVYRCFNEDSK